MSKPYEPAALYRFSDKKTGECIRYVAPSREEGKFYTLIPDSIGIWSCDCEAGQIGRHCVHVAAVSEVCHIRAEAAKQQPAPVVATEQPVATLVAVQASEKPVKSPMSSRPLVPTSGQTQIEAALVARQTAPLNGNRGFSFLR